MSEEERDDVRRRLDELAADVVRRDPDAITEVFRLTEAMLARIAFVLLRDDAAAQDVVQDVFLTLVEQADSLREPDGRGLRAWLARTTRNRSIDVQRSGRSRYEDAAATVPDDLDVDTAADRPIEDPTLLNALDDLTEDQREAIVLFHVAGLSGQEVAVAMGRNRSAVYRLLRRGERRLRTNLDRSNEPVLDRPSSGTENPS